ncbi:RipA family octameric membrane protein [Streptomyces parvus]|uniref:RipA family octameric membrane protein n=1 Tax=Streptomyces parvus TaxID=66428 RepID=UPI003F4D4922
MSASFPADAQHNLEIYKLAVEMADRTSARRATANSYFLTAQTALLSVGGLVGAYSPTGKWWTGATIALAGLALSIAWWLLLGSYRRLSSAKFKVINSIECSLPTRPFSMEWEILDSADGEQSGRRKKHLRLGVTERLVPGVYGALFIVILVATRSQ